MVMDCHGCINILGQFITDELDCQTREEVERHIFSCKVCEKEWQDLTILAFREIERLSHGEIADILDIPLGDVKSRINYARKKLRLTLKEEGYDYGLPMFNHFLWVNSSERRSGLGFGGTCINQK